MYAFNSIKVSFFLYHNQKAFNNMKQRAACVAFLLQKISFIDDEAFGLLYYIFDI